MARRSNLPAWSAAGFLACAPSFANSPPSNVAVAAEAQPVPASRPNSGGVAGPNRAAGDRRTDEASTRVVVPLPHQGPLAHFHDALRALEAKQRREHVRIAWYGDSHGQADFWTGGVRAALQRRFGDAGPGFVHVGMPNYRHDGVSIDRKGGWRMRPKGPARSDRTEDGAFGLGGVLSGPSSGERSVALTLSQRTYDGRSLRWDLCYKIRDEADRFEFLVDGASPSVRWADGRAGQLQHIESSSTKQHRMTLRATAGAPFFCGVYVETDDARGPGLLLDNLGINGARYSTALAWDESEWAAEVRRHPVDLFIFEYGANEASDPVGRPKHYRATAEGLIARARRAAPAASCLVLAPPDRADRSDRMPEIVAALRAAASTGGCEFWDTFDAMGGVGSMARWRDAGKGARDGVHLKARGYLELAALLTEALLAGYRPR